MEHRIRRGGFLQPVFSAVYPENWTLDADYMTADRESVTVRSPAGGFWSVTVYPASTDPVELANAVVEAMGEEYAGLESEEVRDVIADLPLIGYDLAFYYLDLTSSAQIRAMRTEDATYAVFFQAEDREFDAMEQVFRAMATSLLREAAGSGRRGT